MMQEGGVILDIVLFVGICFVFGVFDLEIYFWCVVGCYSSTSRKSGAQNGNLPLFMVAASCENCAVSVIYYLLRRNVNALLTNYSDEDSSIQNKKRKLGGN